MNNISESITLKELCNDLSISLATGRNWVRLGKIVPSFTKNNEVYFDKAYIRALKKSILSDNNQTLKSRRNKNYISGHEFYNSYVSNNCKNVNVLQSLIDITKDYSLDYNLDNLQYLIADCALHLYSSKNNLIYKNDNSLLLKYLSKEIHADDFNLLLDSLITDAKAALDFCKKYPLLFENKYIFEPNEDILGLIYLSFKNMGNRKQSGSYYTPTSIVKKLISNLDLSPNNNLLDPCCGTGNFLLQLPDTIAFENIYGNDIDVISVKIARLNMALKYDSTPISTILEHITASNFLTEYNMHSFSYIIGNPPWGYRFSNEDKLILKKMYATAKIKNPESYDLVIEKSLQCLKPNGQLFFVLPEAILNVKSHLRIREIIKNSCAINYLEYLGDAFDGVQCPCVLLQLINTRKELSTLNMTVVKNNQKFIIDTNRIISPDFFSFHTDNTQYELLNKIKCHYPSVTLKNNAEFALGIVTGNNKEYITNKKTTSNEIIIKGSEITRYHINPVNNYIDFKPDKYQQVAPVKMYRAKEKLFYRFISNQLIFAYDNKQIVSLNSCNILIPKIADMNIKYILAILNSSIATFFFKMEFNSVKVLRSHIESIPIPVIDLQAQEEIVNMVDSLMTVPDYNEYEILYDKLDNMIFNIFNISEQEKRIIKASI